MGFCRRRGPGSTKWRHVSGEGERRTIPFQKQFHLQGQQYSELQNSKARSNSLCLFGSGIEGCAWSSFDHSCQIRHAAALVGFSLYQFKDQSSKSVFIKNTLSAKVRFFLSLEYLPAPAQSSLLTQSERL